MRLSIGELIVRFVVITCGVLNSWCTGTDFHFVVFIFDKAFSVRLLDFQIMNCLSYVFACKMLSSQRVFQLVFGGSLRA